MVIAVLWVDRDPVRGRQPPILPLVVAIALGVMLVLLVHVEHQHGDMRRRVELDVAIAQRSSLRTNEQPHRFVVGAVGAARKPVYEEVLGRLSQRSPRLLAVQGCLRSCMCYAFPVLCERPRTL